MYVVQEVHADEVSHLVRQLSQLNQRKLLLAVGQVIRTQTLERFEDEEGPDGTPWLPSLRVQNKQQKLEETGKRKRFIQLAGDDEPSIHSGKTLVDKGDLKDSIVAQLSGTDEITVGSNMVYALIHQKGGTIEAKRSTLHYLVPGVGWRRTRSVTIPARPYLGMGSDDWAEIQEMVLVWLKTMGVGE